MRRYRKLSTETSHRIHHFTEPGPTVLLPAHDSDAHRLTAMETIELAAHA